MLERQLQDTPSKRPLPRSGPKSTATPPPAIGRSTPDRRGTPDRPRPIQDLPESPEEAIGFSRLSQERSFSGRASSQYDARSSSQHDSRMSQYEHRPLPSRPSIDRSLTRKASRPSLERMPSRPSMDQSSSTRPSIDSSSSRPQLQPMFLSADPNAVRVPLPSRPKSAMAHSGSRSQSSTPSVPPAKTSPKPGTGYLTNLLSRAKSSGNLRSSDARNSAGSSSEDSAMPPTPPYDMGGADASSVRSSKMFKNSISRASNFADRLLHRKDGSHQNADVAIASGGSLTSGRRPV